MQSIKDQLAQLPTSAGVYYFYDQADRLIYIGKAANLKRRVSSYWQLRHGQYHRVFVPQISRIAIKQTDSVLEALILEANEIYLHQPPANIRSKDDKSFVMIGITKELFPGVIVVRPTNKLKVPLARQFGPYPSTELAKNALKIIRRILPFRTTCKIPKSFNLTLPKLHLRSVKGVSVGDHKKIRGCLEYQLGLCPGPCAGKINAQEYRRSLKKVILFLEGKKQQVVRRLEREMSQAAKRQNFELAKKLRDQVFSLHHIRDVSLLRREEPKIQDLPAGEAGSKFKILERIEGYDISNIGPNYAVGSMVVISQGLPEKQAYRKFQIKTVVGQNDLKMMEEVLTRRFRHLEWPLPNLVVIDGGAEHLKVGIRVLKRVKLTLPILGVAKGPERKNLDLYPSVSDLPLSDPDFRARIRLARDEAHRFAIRYHRFKRDTNLL